MARLALVAALLTSLAAAVLASPSSARGDSPNAADVVLVIDHSLSMQGSDPEDRRIEAARDLIDTIAAFGDSFDLRGWRRGIRQSRTLRARRSPRHASSCRCRNLERWGVRDQFRRDEPVRGTDFHSALCLAWRVAVGARPPPGAACPPADIDSALPSAPVDAAGRAKALVLITDGGPAPRGEELAHTFQTAAGCPPNALAQIASTQDRGVYMCGLTEAWTVLTAAFPVEMFVVGIDARNQWFPSTANFWRAITGCEGEQDCARRVLRVPDPAGLTREISKAAIGGVTNLCPEDAGGEQVPAAGRAAGSALCRDQRRTRRSDRGEKP